jgi:hypothetical protein
MKEESSQNNQIYYNKTEILSSIEKNGKYEIDTTLIIKWFNDNYKDSEMYIIKISEKNNKNKIIFIGTINDNFKREGYCVNNYLNGDIYFGYYSNDLRNKSGIYIYKPKPILTKTNKNILYQYYFGLWNNDIKNGKGIYIWIKDEYKIFINNNNKIYNPFQNFEKTNFQAYVGNIQNNNFTKGTLLKKEGNNYFIYFGNFSKELKKEGNNCFYYCSKLEELFFGNFENDVFIEGYVTKFDNIGNIKDIIYFKDKKISNKIDLEKKDNKNISEKITKFTKIIKSQNYLLILHNIFKDIINFKNENMNNITIFNNDKYSQLIDIFGLLNKVTIFEDIENNLKN